MTYESKPFDWQLLLSDFLRILKSVPVLDSVLPADSDIFLFFQSRLPNKSFQAIDLFLMIGTLIPHFSPAYYDQLFVELFGEGNFPELGGVRGKQHRGILLTGEMALFLICREDLQRRQELYETYFCNDHWLFREKILSLEPPLPGEPRLSGRLVMAEEYVGLFLIGRMGKPSLGADFPAQKIDTLQEWDDLVLHPQTRQQVMDLQDWLIHGQALLTDWGLARRVKPGYRVLFYGPPGTGKTLTAALLGKYTEHDVYRVDLSMIVSKYIGETEKNLAKLFDKAEHKGWILFFDEADALFGKRTGVQSSHDRYANQEVSYLLQRVEDYDGLVILASNYKDNIDEAFMRRFQAIIAFPLPRAGERLHLWQKALPVAVQMAADVDLKQIADRYELSGADVVNVVHYICLRAMAGKQTLITNKQVLAGIERELRKTGKKL
ncbi:ATPase family protein associated with various cellular activities (AAA) [Nitrosomonas nitrosa]|uniref:ATP-binding protein n=1 Tax=Nitrosomonas nitrosa TaxID=52442 RepID=UPI000D31A79D|nr:ATP-binding protein [Nitrosomonas nitrosa]PTQ91925.1 ATPase family protein associated with various cellular activities (AAA) [Nitrosomonas nitrosa]